VDTRRDASNRLTKLSGWNDEEHARLWGAKYDLWSDAEIFRSVQ